MLRRWQWDTEHAIAHLRDEATAIWSGALPPRPSLPRSNAPATPLPGERREGIAVETAVRTECHRETLRWLDDAIAIDISNSDTWALAT